MLSHNIALDDQGQMCLLQDRTPFSKPFDGLASGPKWNDRSTVYQPHGANITLQWIPAPPFITSEVLLPLIKSSAWEEKVFHKLAS